MHTCGARNGKDETYVDAPELLNAVKADDLLEQLVPVLLAAWWLGEPEGPGVLKSVLDVEVGRVVEHGDDLVTVGALLAVGGAVGSVSHGAVRRDGDRVQRDLLVGCDLGHIADGCRRCGRWAGVDRSAREV